MRYLLGKLDQILANQARILRLLTKEETTMSNLSDSIAVLTAEVAAETTQDASLVALINGVPKLVADAIASANGDNAAAIVAVQAAVTQLKSNTSGLVDAVNANLTPPAPAAAPPAPATPPTA